MTDTRVGRSKIALVIRRLALPILLGWIALTGITNVAVPSLEEVGEAHTVSMNAHDAPSFIAMKRVGADFKEFDSDANAMVVLEGDKALGGDAHRYYDDLIDKLQADSAHVQHVADFWGDPLTAPGAQSNDGKAAYVQVYLRGNVGESLANESVDAVREIVDQTTHPPGVQVYVT
jgi:RND superfamily putative drug exporter